MKKNVFHLAFPVKNVADSVAFYNRVLGCSLGRSSHDWADINLFGHQITIHYNPEAVPLFRFNSDLEVVPTKHFGIVLDWDSWYELSKNIEKSETPFLIKPQKYFDGEVGEQYSFFILDPNEYAIEFKAFKEFSSLFKC